MAVLGMLGVLMFVAFPSFNEMIHGQRLKVQANDTLAAIIYAKSEALKRRSNVTICAMKTNVDNQCGANGNEWANGWVVFIDSNQDGIVSNGEAVLKSRGDYKKVTSTASVSGFIFNGEGVANTSGDIQFCYMEAKGKKRRRLSLTPGGNPIVSSHDSCI
jgi:type IV fimbrial biogenesis protein FimT